MANDKTAAPEWIDVAFADGFGWSTYATHEGDKTRFIRSDLCASGQHVRALELDEYSPGCLLEAALAAHPPQPSETVAEEMGGGDVIALVDPSDWDAEPQLAYARGWNAALRALKGADNE